MRTSSSTSWLTDLARDLPYALRSLRRTPAFTIAALLTLAVGIGANASVFSLVNAVLLTPLPYAEPERLVRVYETLPGGWGNASWLNFRDWRDASHSFEQLVLYQPGSRNLQGTEQAERVSAVAATADLFAALGARPLLGRAFAPGEDAPGEGRVAVLSESAWRARFGADPSVVGRGIALDGRLYTIVGVMPRAFSFPPRWDVDVWVPFVPTPNDEQARGSHWFDVVGRLKPGVSVAAASAEMRQIAERLERQYPDSQAGRGVMLRPLREDTVGYARPALLLLTGAVGLVLLIACANVANLMLARAAARQRDVAVRTALGATRGQIARQYLTESVVLALAGAALGGALAWWLLGAMRTLLQRALPVGASVPLDRTVLVFLLAVAVASGVVFGLVPALQRTPGRLRDALAEGGARGGTGGGQRRLRAALVVSEIALSLVLLAGAGLLIRGFVMLRGTAPGLDTHDVLTVHLPVATAQFPQSGAAADRLLRPVLERVRAIPGVTSAGVITRLPLQGWGTNGDFWVEGRPEPERGTLPWAEYRWTSPAYFAALGIAVRAGRDFTERDGAGADSVAPGVIVNETLARTFFPGENAVGRRLTHLGPVPVPIVGVVGDVRQAGLDRPPLPEIYVPYTTLGRNATDVVLVVKTAVPPATVVQAVRAAVRAVAPAEPVYAVRTMEEVVSRSLADRRLHLWLLGGFAAVALVLAAGGLYGVISYLVAQRTREIGIRMALGARQRDVLRLVLGQGATLTAVGLAAGLAGALALTRFLASMLYGVGARDPLTFAAVAAVLGAVSLLASYLPARRAARVDPVVALRAE